MRGAPEEEETPIRFTKKVDSDGRVVVPQEIRKLLKIDGREAVVEFTGMRVGYLDEVDERGET